MGEGARVAGFSEEEIERLANRLAMLVSDDGEADNAGRAVGSLARRLGLTGGQLKAIFMAGAESAGGHAAKLEEQATRIARLEREVTRLRSALADAEAVTWELQRERDELREEAMRLHGVLGRRRAGRRGWLLGALISVIALGAIAVGAVYVPGLVPGREVAATGTPTYHTAVVRDREVVLRKAPDSGSAGLLTLPVGTRMSVHRVFWHNLLQWVEVEVDGQIGYVPSTAVDLS